MASSGERHDEFYMSSCGRDIVRRACFRILTTPKIRHDREGLWKICNELATIAKLTQDNYENIREVHEYNTIKILIEIMTIIYEDSPTLFDYYHACAQAAVKFSNNYAYKLAVEKDNDNLMAIAIAIDVIRFSRDLEI